MLVPLDNSVLKRSALSSYGKTLRNPKCLFLSQRSQSENPTYFLAPTVGRSGNSKLWTVNRSAVARG